MTRTRDISDDTIDPPIRDEVDVHGWDLRKALGLFRSANPTLLDWLPDDLSGMRLLDAGCGTGAMAVELARRGAWVTAVDLSENLIELARERLPDDVDPLAFESVEVRLMSAAFEAL